MTPLVQADRHLGCKNCLPCSWGGHLMIYSNTAPDFPKHFTSDTKDIACMYFLISERWRKGGIGILVTFLVLMMGEDWSTHRKPINLLQAEYNDRHT